MAVYLDELMVGTHPTEICFPHLLVCAGVVCQLANGTLVGGHIAGPASEGTVLDLMTTQIGVVGSAIVQVYIIADFPVHFSDTHMRLTDKVRRLGFVGSAQVLDTHGIVTGDGAYARVESLGAGNGCRVFALPDQTARPYPTSMFATYAPGGVMQQVRLYQGDVASPVVVRTGDVAPRPGVPIAAGQFKIARVN